MARKKKTSPAEDLMEIVAMLPWWLGVALAIIFYFVLHSYASVEVSLVAGRPDQIAQLAVGSLEQTLAGIGQYLVPLLCMVGAAVSALRRRSRAGLVEDVIKGDGSAGLNEMSWQDFERVVGEAFRLQGYSVTENGGGGADGGIDLVLRKNGEKFLVQCKQWKALKVGVTVVRELYGVMAADGAAGGFVVTCGRFTEEATVFASGRNVTLLDGSKLEKMIRQTRGALASSPATQPAPVPQPSGVASRCCPICGDSMVQRMAKRGANAGNKFWGCVAYPACKGTTP